MNQEKAQTVQMAMACLSEHREIPVKNAAERYSHAKSALLPALTALKHYLPEDNSERRKLSNEIINECLNSVDEYTKCVPESPEATADARDFVWFLMTMAEPESELRQRLQKDYDHLYEKSRAYEQRKDRTQSSREDIDYEACETIADFENYLNSYPEGRHADEAKQRLEEEKFWKHCLRKNTTEIYQQYLTWYPDGKYASEARSKARSLKDVFTWLRKHPVAIVAICFPVLAALVGLLIGVLEMCYVLAGVGLLGLIVSIFYPGLGTGRRASCIAICLLALILGVFLEPVGEDLKLKRQAKESYLALDESSGINDFKNVFYNHYSRLPAEMRDEFMERYYVMSLDSCMATIGYYSSGDYGTNLSGLGFLKNYIGDCGNLNLKQTAAERMIALVDSLYDIASQKDTYPGWKEYQASVPPGDFRDSNERKHAAQWANDEYAWEAANRQTKPELYEKYLSFHPKGNHAAEAEQKIIDLLVESVFKGEHGDLPEMEQTRATGGTITRVSITNDTSYELTVLYSGTESKRLVLRPHGTGSLKLKNGVYRVAATVSGNNVLPYAGHETLNGGSYDSNFYISSPYSFNRNVVLSGPKFNRKTLKMPDISKLLPDTAEIKKLLEIGKK